MPDQHPAGFAGYLASGRVVSPPSLVIHLPSIGFGMGALIDWFPYDLPAGRYRLMIRRIGGARARGTYDLSISGVSSS